jgi:hypothetical protein
VSEHVESEQLLALSALRAREDPRALKGNEQDAALRVALAHVNTCSYCEARLRENEALFALLDGENVPALVSPALRARVLATVAGTPPVRTPWARLAVLAMTAASVALAWFDGRGSNPLRLSDLVPSMGAHCLASQAGFAAIPLAVGMVLSRAGKARLLPLPFAAWSMGFAVLGQLWLRNHCGANNLSVHLFAFHFVGVLLAGLIGAGLGRLLGPAHAA